MCPSPTLHRLNPALLYPAPLWLIHTLRLSSGFLLLLPHYQAYANWNNLNLRITTHHPEALCSDRVMLSLPSLLIRPHPPVWIALSDFPCGYTKSPCHSRAILTATQTFPPLATRPCMIATCSTPEELIGAYPISLPISTSNHPLTTGLTSPSEVTTLLTHACPRK